MYVFQCIVFIDNNNCTPYLPEEYKKLKSIVKHRPFPRFATLTQRAKALERDLLFNEMSDTRQLQCSSHIYETQKYMEKDLSIGGKI